MSDFPAAVYDLHLHTGYSYDATAQIEPYFRRARELGVRCIAITEHHNIDSASEVQQVAARYPDVRVIPAAELSVTTSIGAVDLLCYNLPLQPAGLLAEVLAEYHDWQRQRADALVQGMQKLGYDYTAEHHLALLQSYRPQRALDIQGATHVKNGFQNDYFVQRGFIDNVSQMPQLYQRLRQVVDFPSYPPVERVTTAVKQAGGLIVIAHPAGYFQGNDEKRMDMLRQECRLDGIECAHRAVSPELTDCYRSYCVRHSLLSTGGSDSHMPEDLDNPAGIFGYTREHRFASHIGQPQWLDELLERL